MNLTLLAQVAPIAMDTATPFSLVVVVMLLGLAVAFGTALNQIATLRENFRELGARVTERERHGGDVDKSLAAITATLHKVDENVERLLTASQQQSA